MMHPPIAAVLAGELMRAVDRWECAQQHPKTYKPCVLRSGHAGLHKTEMSQRWDRARAAELRAPARTDEEN